MSSRVQSLTPYAEFTRIGFVNILAFRLRYYAGIFTYLINVTVYYFIWSAVYRARGISATRGGYFHIGGYDLPQMLTYVAIGWVIRSLYWNTIDQEMAYEVIDGKIAMDFIKPVSIQWMWICRALGETAFRLVMLTAPSCVVIALLFPVRSRRRWTQFGLFLIAVMWKYIADGRHQFHDWHLRDSADVHPVFNSREVLADRSTERSAGADDVFPRGSSKNRRVASLPAHRVHSPANLSGQIKRHGCAARAGHAMDLDCRASLAGRLWWRAARGRSPFTADNSMSETLAKTRIHLGYAGRLFRPVFENPRQLSRRFPD